MKRVFNIFELNLTLSFMYLLNSKCKNHESDMMQLYFGWIYMSEIVYFTDMLYFDIICQLSQFMAHNYLQLTKYAKVCIYMRTLRFLSVKTGISTSHLIHSYLGIKRSAICSTFRIILIALLSRWRSL